jgi:hypothetical protein
MCVDVEPKCLYLASWLQPQPQMLEKGDVSSAMAPAEGRFANL